MYWALDSLLDTRSSRENLRELPLDGGEARTRWLTRGNTTDRQPTYSQIAVGRVLFESRGNLDSGRESNERHGPPAHRRCADDWTCPTRPMAVDSCGIEPDGSVRDLGGEPRRQRAAATQPRRRVRPETRRKRRTANQSSTVPQPRTPGLWRMRRWSDPVRLSREPSSFPSLARRPECPVRDGLSGMIRVVHLQDGAVVPFDIGIVRRTNTTAVLGRAR